MKTFIFIFFVALISLTSCNSQVADTQQPAAVVSDRNNNSVEAKKVMQYWWNVTTYQDFRFAYQKSSGQGC